MRRHTLELIPTKNMSRQVWLSKRQEGLGGSDMGTIMGVNKNISRLELFHQKCGITLENFKTNPAIHWGNTLEDIVRHNSQFLNLETGEYLPNVETGEMLRTISEFKYMVRNPKYPWLIANIDGLENLDKKKWMADSVSEMKTISRQSAEMWETFPPYHFFQVIMYHMVLAPMLRTDVSRIFYLRDGRDLYGYEIPFNQDVADTLIKETKDFWERIVEGRKIVQANIRQGVDVIIDKLMPIEPEPEAIDTYESYLSELFKLKSSPSFNMTGDEFLLDHTKSYHYIGKEIVELEKQRTISKVAILDTLRKRGAGRITWENNESSVTYNKRIYVTVKD